jgi:hypothetical protein
MQCNPTQVPDSDAVDIPALKVKYLAERNKRIRTDGQAQYERPAGGAVESYVTDPKASTRKLTWRFSVRVLGVFLPDII